MTSQAYIDIIRDVIADTALQGKECTTELLVAKPFQILPAVKKKIELIELIGMLQIKDTSEAEEGATGSGQPTRSGKTEGSKEKVKEEKVITKDVEKGGSRVTEITMAGISRS